MRSRADAEDLMQMACERALSHIAQWNSATRLDSWLFRIMQTVWISELRRRQVRERYTKNEVTSQAMGSLLTANSALKSALC